MSMGTFEVLLLAKKCYSEYTTLTKLFSDDGLIKILQEIGEAEFSAAIWALQSSRKSNNPKIGIIEAISHLRSASVLFLRSVEKRRIFGLLPAKARSRATAYDSAIRTLLVMVICYRYLNERQQEKEILYRIDSILPEYELSLIKSIEDSFTISRAALNSQSFSGMPILEDSMELDEREKISIEDAKINIKDIRETISEILAQII